jgi:hypothetical protein
MTDFEFLTAIQQRGFAIYDQAIALLWWTGRTDPLKGLTPREICSALEATGLPAQNVSRLSAKLAVDGRVSKARTSGGWRLHPNARAKVAAAYADLASPLHQPVDTNSVIPTGLVSARRYLEKVVVQLNLSYDNQLFDCCAVMCRRTLETLLIEVYEHAGRSNEIKGADGHFLMLNGLAAYFEQDPAFGLSRNGLQGLRDFKKLGDLSAHNRRFNARREDVDRVRDGLRVAVEELAHLAGLTP